MELTQSHRVTYAEICVPMADPAKSECHHVMNKPVGSMFSVRGNITHKACYSIDTAKELQK